mmetsp:Transcript_20687/g.50987  ORF Transcript_20687/g.50987 Transcript_20687/m.50987 type:complete len:153 (-) Transcript_20687:215-673(-)
MNGGPRGGPQTGRGGGQGYNNNRGGAGGQQQFKYTMNARNAVPGQQQMDPQQLQQQDAQQQDVRVPAPELTLEMLANASPHEQKQMLGEKLYPVIYEKQPQLAGKVTGMLLEMDNSEILHLLESPEALNEKVEEALHALQSHSAARPAQPAE